MQDKTDAVFSQLVYAVTALLYGEHPGTNTIFQRVVADALRHRGVYEVLKAAVDDGKPSDDGATNFSLA